MKQCFYKKFFFFAFLLSSAAQLKTTYIIYKTKDMRTVEAPTQEEFNKAYEILMTYQFPMSMDNGQDEIAEIKHMLKPENRWALQRDNGLNYLRMLDAIPFNVSNEKELEKYLSGEENLKEVQDALLHRITKLEKESNFTKFMALTSDDQKKLIQHEQDFLTEKIKKIDASLSLSFIPTTVYELLFFKFYIKGLQVLNRETRYTFVLANDNFIDLDKLFITGGRLASSSIRNTSKLMCELQKDINTRIIHFFDDTYNKIQCERNDIKNMMPSLLTSLKTLSDKVNKNIRWSMIEGFSQIAQSKDFLSKAIEAEFEANSKQCFPLYRGTNGFKGKLDNIIGAGGGKSGPYEGLSYGNSIFAGIFLDVVGEFSACAYSHIKRKSLGYVLLIPKETYRNVNKSTSQKFFSREDTTTGISYYIPPLNTLCGMLSGGEFFHPRLSASNEDKATEHNFQTLIHTNARILKNTSDFSDKQLTEAPSTVKLSTEKETVDTLAQSLQEIMQ